MSAVYSLSFAPMCDFPMHTSNEPTGFDFLPPDLRSTMALHTSPPPSVPTFDSPVFKQARLPIAEPGFDTKLEPTTADYITKESDEAETTSSISESRESSSDPSFIVGEGVRSLVRRTKRNALARAKRESSRRVESVVRAAMECPLSLPPSPPPLKTTKNNNDGDYDEEDESNARPESPRQGADSDARRVQELEGDPSALKQSTELRVELRMLKNKMYAREARRRKKRENEALHEELATLKRRYAKLLRCVETECTEEQQKRIKHAVETDRK